MIRPGDLFWYGADLVRVVSASGRRACVTWWDTRGVWHITALDVTELRPWTGGTE